jgi:hypothetical protein
MNQKHNIEELYKPLYISHKPNDEKWLELPQNPSQKRPS